MYYRNFFRAYAGYGNFTLRIPFLVSGTVVYFLVNLTVSFFTKSGTSTHLAVYPTVLDQSDNSPNCAYHCKNTTVCININTTHTRGGTPPERANGPNEHNVTVS